MANERNKVILVIDDERMVRMQLRSILEAEGFTVCEAGNGNEGLTRVVLFCPDLVITDILMPDKEGIETILELRHHHTSVRIIAISGGGRIGNKDFLRTAKHLGADRTLAKPFGKEALLKAVHDVLDM